MGNFGELGIVGGLGGLDPVFAPPKKVWSLPPGAPFGGADLAATGPEPMAAPHLPHLVAPIKMSAPQAGHVGFSSNSTVGGLKHIVLLPS